MKSITFRFLKKVNNLVDQSSDKITKTIEEISQYLDGQNFLFAEILDKKSKLEIILKNQAHLQLCQL